MTRAFAALGRLAAIAVGAAIAMVAFGLMGGTSIGGGASGSIGSGGGNLTQAFADTLYCKLTGCTMAGATTYSGVTNDITTAGSEDLRLAPGGSVVLKSADDSVDIEDSAGAADGAILTTASGGVTTLCFTNTGASGGELCAENQMIIAGSKANRALSEGTFAIADSVSPTGRTLLWTIFGTGVEQMTAGVTANNNLAGTSACAASGDVGKRVLYSDTGSNKITQCICEQTGVGTFAWGAVTGAGDCT